MRTWASGTARAALLTAGFVALGAGTAFSASAYADTTNGNSSALGGNQLNLPVSVPVDLSGNAIALFGTANAGSKGGSTVTNGGSGYGGQGTSGRSSIGGGNQINAPISVPIDACGNAIAIFGTADAGCKGGASVTNKGSGGGRTNGTSSIGGGNQINAPISVPIDACGNAIAIFGSAEAGCKGGASVTNDSHSGTGRTDGTSSLLGGNQAYAPISAPVDVCGNAAGTFGDAVAGCAGGAKVHNGSGPGSMHTTGKGSVGGGNQAYAPVSAPIDVCGNGATASCEGGASVHNAGTPPMNTVGGSQVYAPVGAPVVVCGNAVAVHGQAGARCAGGSTVATNPGDPTTSGKEGVLSGNQAYAPITAPVNICGNAVAVAGDASAGCVGTAHAASSSAGNVVTSGEHGIGAGNQVIAPVKAPVDVCGNTVAVAGSADPECGIGSGGGVMMTDRNAQRAGAPAALGMPVLPMVPGLVKALPVTAGALPQLPVALPVAQSAPADNSLPGLPSLPVSGLPVGALPVGALPVGGLPVGGLPVSGLPQLPAGLQQLPAEGGLPRLPAGLPQLPVGGLPNGSPLRTAQSAVPAPFPAPVSMLPDLFGGLPGSLPGGLLPGGLSSAGVLPNGLVPAGVVPAMPQVPVHQAAPAPLLPGLPQIPLVGDGTAGIVGGHLNPPQLGSVRDTLNSVRLSADSTPVNSGYALALGALLAGASMLLTLGRRFRRH